MPARISPDTLIIGAFQPYIKKMLGPSEYTLNRGHQATGEVLIEEQYHTTARRFSRSAAKDRQA